MQRISLDMQLLFLYRAFMDSLHDQPQHSAAGPERHCTAITTVSHADRDCFSTTCQPVPDDTCENGSVLYRYLVSKHGCCAMLRRDKELAAVKVTAADIDVVAAEAEVDKKLAERRLREHGGNLLEALKSFL